MSTRNVYLNGRIVPANDAKISVADAGFLHGASVFTTMLARNGAIFRFDRHLKRLLDTVGLFDLRTDATAESLRGGVDELLAANGLTDARVRITLSPGAVGRDEPTTVITADPMAEYPAEWYTQGIGVIVSSFRQVPESPTTGVKTGCYFPRVLARQEAAARGAEEALWYTADNHLAEACFCNVFLVADGTVRTPPRETPVLGGVVQQAVFEICRDEEIPCDAETPLTVHDMLEAEEVFLTSSCAGIRPVIRIEKHDVGKGVPGPVTQRIMAAYRELLDSECPPQAAKESSDEGFRHH